MSVRRHQDSGRGVPEPRGDLKEYVRTSDLRAMGLTRTDADFVMRHAGRMLRFGKSFYARREDVERVLKQYEKRWPVSE